MNINIGYGGGGEDPNNSYCYFHPKEFVIGVCPFCLNDRLLILAANQSRRHNRSSSTSSASARTAHHLLRRHRTSISFVSESPNNNNNNNISKKPPINLQFPKIFALGSFLNRLEFRPSKNADISDDNNYDASSSPEDSFISIKIEDNGVASWEKGTVSKVSLDHCSTKWSSNKESNNKSVIEHVKQPRGTSSLRWRKRIGHLFQLVRWKRSNKASVCHVGTKVEGVKVRKSWIRNLTKREGPKNNSKRGMV